MLQTSKRSLFGILCLSLLNAPRIRLRWLPRWLLHSSSPFVEVSPSHSLSLTPMPASQPDPPESSQQSLCLRNEEEVLRAPVGARFLEFWGKWKIRGAEPWIIKVLKEGYAILFLKSPPLVTSPVILPAYSRGSVKHSALLEEVSSIILKRAIEEVKGINSEGLYNCLFCGSQNIGGWRTVLDVSSLSLSGI